MYVCYHNPIARTKRERGNLDRSTPLIAAIERLLDMLKPDAIKSHRKHHSINVLYAKHASLGHFAGAPCTVCILYVWAEV